MMEKLEKPAKFKIIRKVEVIEEERKVPDEGNEIENENENENENTKKVGNRDFSISKSDKVKSNSEGFFDKEEESIVLSGSVLGLGLGVIAAVAWGTVIYMRNVRK